ncbi:hypothetical protein FPQ18DRAFT_316541 [Pyronema domesticum]|nr:hypothetical protein FPQ18DRAFT_316541 [Pyronema domesticum]
MPFSSTTLLLPLMLPTELLGLDRCPRSMRVLVLRSISLELLLALSWWLPGCACSKRVLWGDGRSRGVIFGLLGC